MTTLNEFENMKGLRNALALVDQAGNAHLDACRVTWAELRKADPSIAEAISSLFSNEDVAAKWSCSPHNQGLSPAEMVLAGRSDLVLSIVRKAEYGFGA